MSAPPVFVDLSGVTYLDRAALKGRVALLLPFWDGESWHLWLPVADGRYVHMRPADAGSTEYVSKEAARPTDLLIHFVNFMWQHAAWPSTHKDIGTVTRDFHNLGTSVAKIDHAFACRKEIGFGASDFVKTELEYLLVVARRIFDNLQKTVATLWHKHVRLLDDAANAKKRRPKESFTKTVLKDRQVPRSRDELIAEFGFSEALADTYETVTPFFVKILRLRDAIVHGHSATGPLGLIFDTDKGWCIGRECPEVAMFDIWTESHRHNEKLSSLRPLLAHIVLGTIQACNEVVAGLARQIIFPPPMAPGCQVFLRGYNDSAIIRLDAILKGGDPWWSAAEQNLSQELARTTLDAAAAARRIP